MRIDMMRIRTPSRFDKYRTDQSLNLSNTGITAQDIPELLIYVEENQITTLNLNGRNIGDKGATVLANNQTITTLIVSNNGIKAKGAEALAKNQIIKTLNISGNDIGDRGAKALAENQTITDLNISRCYVILEGAK